MVKSRSKNFPCCSDLTRFIRTGEYLLVPYSESLTDLAAALIKRHPLRALYAIQLGSALQLRNALPPDPPPLLFLSADGRLVTIARQEHLQVENPESFA
jgi:hypothetical protein